MIETVYIFLYYMLLFTLIFTVAYIVIILNFVYSYLLRNNEEDLEIDDDHEGSRIRLFSLSDDWKPLFEI